MYYNSDEIDEDLKCSYCRRRFVEEPKLLPVCGESICADCYATELAGSREFTCQACQQTHQMPERGLDAVKSLGRLIKRRKVEKPLSDSARQLKASLDSLGLELRALEAFDEREHVNHYCDLLEVEIVEEIESLVEQLNAIRAGLLEQIGVYRAELLDHCSVRSSGRELEALGKELGEFVSRWTDYFTRMDVLAAEQDVEAALVRVRKFEKKMTSLRSKLKSDVFGGRVMAFKTNHAFSGDPNLLKNMFSLVIHDEKPSELRIESTSRLTFVGHSDTVTQVVFLCKHQLASCSEDATLRVWNVQTGSLVYELRGSVADEFYSVAALPNGWLASASKDKRIRLWDPETQTLLKTLRGHVDSVNFLAVLADGNLASYSIDDTIRIWNPYCDDNNLLRTIAGHGNSRLFMPFGVLSTGCLVTCSRDQDDETECVLRVWDPSNGALVKSTLTGSNDVSALVALNDDRVALGFEDGTIRIFSLEEEEDEASTCLSVENAFNGEVSTLAQLANGDLVGCGESVGSHTFVKVWRLADLRLVQEAMVDHSDTISSLSLSPDGLTLASGSYDNKVKLFAIEKAGS